MGRQLLRQNRKLYVVDLGLRRHLAPRQNDDLGYSLENTVYLELLRRGAEVCVGKVGKTEVDFVARRGDEVHYYQVTANDPIVQSLSSCMADLCTRWDRQAAPTDRARPMKHMNALTSARVGMPQPWEVSLYAPYLVLG